MEGFMFSAPMIISPGDVDDVLENSVARGLFACGEEVFEPYEGMEVDSEEAARSFYNAYATQVGFKVRVSSFIGEPIDELIGRGLGIAHIYSPLLRWEIIETSWLSGSIARRKGTAGGWRDAINRRTRQLSPTYSPPSPPSHQFLLIYIAPHRFHTDSVLFHIHHLPFSTICNMPTSMAVETNGAANGHVPKPAAPVVRVNATSMVVPNNGAVERPPCPLITFDVPYITFYYNQKLLLYKTPAGSDDDFDCIVARMKEGLAAVLGHFYPLAGRIEQDEHDGSLLVRCSGDSLVGAEVIEAAAEGVAVDELAEGGATSLLQEVVPYTGIMNLEGLHRPLLAVQFTKLKDGLALGCAFNHAILDGNSTWHFMTSWAELTRTGSTTIAVPPFLDRTKARPTRFRVELPSSPKAHELADPNGPPKPLVAKVFSFSHPALTRLKSEANANLPADSKPLSTFQALGAHVWRSVCRARGLKPEDITVFAIFIDCRTRVDPPMPNSYFGNLIQAIFTVTATGLLLASPPEFGACLMQGVIDAHDAEAINLRLEAYEGKPKMLHYTDAGINCVAVGSSPRFRVYDVDFGFGRPSRVRGGSNNKFDGMMFLYPGRDEDHDGKGEGGIDVELTLDVEAMKNLENDDAFLNVVNIAAA